MSGDFNDVWGGVGMTLVDSLDTLWLMGMKEEFRSGLQWVEESLALESLQEVSVADYGARLLGGLLAVYEIAHSEVLLVKAAKVGDLLLKAFDGELFPSVESFSRSHVAEYRAGDRGDDAQRARDAGGGGDAGGGAATPLRSDARQAVRDGSGATADGAAAAGDAGRRVPRPDIPLTPLSRP